MGGCFSCCRCSRPCSFDCVRVVHINGYIEEFPPPVKVSHVTGKPPKHVLCSSSHLLSLGSTPLLLQPNDTLQPGIIYFLLPHTVFLSDSSPVDLAVLLRRLKAIGTAGPKPLSRRSKSSRPQEDQPADSLPRARIISTWLPDLSTIDERSMERSASMLSTDSSISILVINPEGHISHQLTD